MAKQHSKKSSFAMLQPFSTKFGAKIAQNQRIKKLSFKILIFSLLPLPPLTPSTPFSPSTPSFPPPSKKVPSAFRAEDFYQDSFSRSYFTKIFFTSPLLVRTMLIPFWSELTRVPEMVKICAAFVMFSAVAVAMPEASALGSCALLVPK